MTFLLRNVLGRTGTEGGQTGRDAPPPPQLIMPQDTGKLKKHVGILLDKVTKAAQQLVLSDPPQDTAAGKRNPLYIHTTVFIKINVGLICTNISLFSILRILFLNSPTFPLCYE